MTVIATYEETSNDVYAGLVSGLETEFGSTECGALAQAFLAGERADFYWEARAGERYLGASESLDDEGYMLDRVAVIGVLAARWYAGVAEVDGEGAVHDLCAVRQFASAWDAHGAFAELV